MASGVKALVKKLTGEIFFIVVEKVACGSEEGVTMQHGDSAAQ